MTGQTLSHYRLLEKLGEGASAVVYKADDLALGRAVVLKLVSPELSGDSGTLVRFHHEARTASSLNHPNICTIYEIAQHEDRQFVVMELLDGQDLSRVIGGRPIETYRAIELAIQIADGLEAAHAEGIVHRDIKPANIFITRRDHVKILDFGLAVLLPRRAPGAKATVVNGLPTTGGTIPYMSPEQTRGENLDARSDLFSAGVVLYEMITGRRPFAGAHQAAVMDAIVNSWPLPPSELNPSVPPELDRIINKALEKNRKLRFQTASDLRADLQRLKRDLDSAAAISVGGHPHGRIAPHTAPPIAVAPPARPLGRIAIGAAIVLAAGVLAASAMRGSVLPSQSPPPAGPPLVADVRPPAAASQPRQPAADTEGGALALQANIPLPANHHAPAPPAAVAAATAPDKTWARRELALAGAKLEARLYDQALVTLQGITAEPGAGEAATEAYFLIASIHERRGKLDDAMATYLEILSRYRDHPRAPEALFLMAQDTLRSERPEREKDARRLFTELAASYAESPWAPRALLARAQLEERQRTYQRDAALATSVPSALVTYRQIATQYSGMPAAEDALWKLSQLLGGVKRHDLAARALVELATNFPETRYDAWFAAAELFDKRLNEPARAQSSYARVSPTSPRFKDAQKRIRQ